MSDGRNFRTLVGQRWPETLLCVGLDTDPKKILRAVRHALVAQGYARDYSDEESVFGLNAAIIMATCDLVCAYKPNLAYYEGLGERGVSVLMRTCDFIKANAPPDVVIIGDGKRGDIGNSNAGYIKSVFDFYGMDAVTVHNYLGDKEGMDPFLDRADKGIIVLCHTTNKGADQFQHLVTLPAGTRINEIPEGMTAEDWLNYLSDESMQLYKRVAYHVSKDWNRNGNCAVVAGATYPEQLGEVRKIVGDDMPILIPGIGTQGGDLERSVRNGVNSRGDGIIINASRSVLYASDGLDFDRAARAEAMRLRDEINKYRR